ncbi:MAG TPA: methyltransferase domain-containing protein [Burkholderiales bacterium]|nr:methyltransferase domain-containing protein [Burkholderiales bacterium]
MRLLVAVLLCASMAAARGEEVEWQVPFITTPEEVVERMLELAGTRADDLVVDLGSGDGRIVIMAARKFGARGLGIELDQRLVEKSRDNARAAGVAARVSFMQGDVLTADISKASVVTVYLLPGLIGQLQQRFTGELRPGTRIVSHAFGMTGWTPDRTGVMRLTKSHPGQGDESRLFLWIVPADVRGLWRGDGHRFSIEQNYQQIEVDGVNGRLSGSDVSWGRFRGRVDGDRMSGEMDGKPLVLIRSR